MKNYIRYIIIFLLPGLFSGCKKDELNSKELLAYIKGDVGDGKSMSISFNRTPISVSGGESVSFAGYLTRSTSASVNLTVAVDDSKLTDYNNTNITSYKLLPAENYKITSGSLTIPENATVSSDSVKIQLLNRDKLTDVNGYLLPITLQNVSSDDKGVIASNTYKTIYLVVTSVYTNIDLSSKTAIAGTVISRTSPAWTIVSATTPYTSSYAATNVLDGANASAWFTYGTNPFITIDMGTSNAVKGFVLCPAYSFGATYNATGIEVQTSTDNVTWISQGTYKADAVLSTSSATAPDYRNINFYGAVSCRYAKFIMVTLPSTYGGFAEINAIK